MNQYLPVRGNHTEFLVSITVIIPLIGLPSRFYKLIQVNNRHLYLNRKHTESWIFLRGLSRFYLENIAISRPFLREARSLTRDLLNFIRNTNISKNVSCCFGIQQDRNGPQMKYKPSSRHTVMLITNFALVVAIRNRDESL